MFNNLGIFANRQPRAASRRIAPLSFGGPGNDFFGTANFIGGGQGAPGFTGSTGFTGSSGPAGGFTGSAGFTGSNGFTGSIGFTGSAGFTGSSGFTGSVGFTGSNGFTGSIGFTGSAALLSPVTVTDVATATYTALATDYFLCVLTVAPVTITLPTGILGTVYIVKDCGGLAATNPITVQGTGGQLVDGAASANVNTNFGSLTFIFDGTEWSIV